MIYRIFLVLLCVFFTQQASFASEFSNPLWAIEQGLELKQGLELEQELELEKEFGGPFPPLSSQMSQLSSAEALLDDALGIRNQDYKLENALDYHSSKRQKIDHLGFAAPIHQENSSENPIQQNPLPPLPILPEWPGNLALPPLDPSLPPLFAPLEPAAQLPVAGVANSPIDFLPSMDAQQEIKIKQDEVERRIQQQQELELKEQQAAARARQELELKEQQATARAKQELEQKAKQEQEVRARQELEVKAKQNLDILLKESEHLANPDHTSWDFYGDVLDLVINSGDFVVQQIHQIRVNKIQNTTSQKMLLALLSAATKDKDNRFSGFQFYFNTKDAAKKKLDKAIEGALRDFTIQKADKKNFKKHINNLLWRLFVKKFMTDAPLEDVLTMTELNLSKKSLSKLPEQLGCLNNLRTIDLSHNYLSELPDWIGHCAQLTKLNICSNKITLIPESFAKLTELVEWKMNSNKVEELPDIFANLGRLRVLIIGANKIETLPNSFRHLKELRELKANNCKFVALPDWFGELQRLTQLDFVSNMIQLLPDSMGNLANLRSLNLRKNQLQVVPRTMANLRDINLIRLTANPMIQSNREGPFGLEELQNALEGVVEYNAKVNRELEPVRSDVPIATVLARLNQMTLRINRQTLLQLNPPPVPLCQLTPEMFMGEFNKAYQTMNFAFPQQPGYLECSLFNSYTEQEIKEKGNQIIMNQKIRPRLSGFLKALVGLPLLPDEPEGWQMYDAQRQGLKNSLSFIFKAISGQGDKSIASMLFTQLVNGILHCPTGQKEGVDTVVLSITASDGDMKRSSDFRQRVLAQLGFLKNDVWQREIIPGDHAQNVHISSFYATKLKEYLNIFDAIGNYKEKIMRPGGFDDPYKNSPGRVLQKFFDHFNVDFVASELQKRIQTYADQQLREQQDELIKKLSEANTPATLTANTDILHQQLKEKNEALLKESDASKKEEIQESIMRIKMRIEMAERAMKSKKPTLTPQEHSQLVAQLQKIKKEMSKITRYLRPYTVMNVIDFLMQEKLVKIIKINLGADQRQMVQGGNLFFDKDILAFLNGDLSPQVFPNVTLDGIKRILLHIKVFEGNI